VNPRGLNGLGEDHHRQDGGGPPGRHSGHKTDASVYFIC
jgi:hypothetical protein